jgi:hypothetical protein
MPAVVAAIALAAEPALITADDFANNRAGIDDLGVDPGDAANRAEDLASWGE